ncbi:MAG: MurT ligase domain-containing protein, partial [Acidimicrobiia bacterium]|nr:MurT ligase domain-containing protein [Acidimicrobiia bacterium]
MLRLRIATLVGRLAGRVSQLLGRGGSAIPGLVGERIAPRLIEDLVGRLPVVVVTGTNGKTTTTKLLVGMLEAGGRRVITNPSGSNLARGIATRLIEVSHRGRIDADLAVFEIDEAAVRSLGPRLKPRMVVVTNLARDQLDRYGELDTTAAHIRAALEHTGTAVLNADDPLVAGLAGTAGSDVFFGGADGVRAAMPDDRTLYGDESAARPGPEPDLLVVSADAEGDGQQVDIASGGRPMTIRLQLPGVYNAYNTAAALLAASTMGMDIAVAVGAAEAVVPAWGRGQVIDYQGRRIRLLLVKNPAGFNQAIRLLTEAPQEAPVLIAINDNTADGRDVSWLWDARIEDLAGTRHRYATAGIRALDMAVRLKYAGIEAAWSEPDPGLALARFIEGIPAGG